MDGAATHADAGAMPASQLAALTTPAEEMEDTLVWAREVNGSCG